LEGFDDDWRPVRDPSVAYTGLRPDTYILHARTTTPAGLREAVPATLSIVILPPWWDTTWFILLVIASGIGVIASLFRWRVADVNLQNRRLDELVSQRTVELGQTVEMLRLANEQKSRFFSNISHELRTPLTLIGGYLEDLKEDRVDQLSPHQGKRVVRATGLVNRLDSLVTQLLDLARADGKTMQLDKKPGDLCAFVHRIVSHYSVAARRNFIDLTFEHQEAAVWFEYDPIKLDQVVSNLIGNALKFTPKNGSVWISLAVNKGTVELTVADTGSGIPEESLDRIFERFYQVDGGLTREHEGLGIGLSLTKDFVELHGGTISVRSQQGEGAVFTVSIPAPEIGDTAPAPEEAALYHDLTEYDVASDTEMKTLLLVEDNRELRKHIVDVLSDLFNIKEAAEGASAWKIIQKQAPDIVLTDVMMPGMSGLDLLREIRMSPKFENLPVVLLTARSGMEAQVEALEARADDFVAKPFNRRALRARLLNLVRREVEWRAATEQNANALSGEDEKFLATTDAFIMAHITVEDLSVAQLADVSNVSERTFQRKIKEVTGMAGATYIRTVKLNHAKSLLEEGTVRSVTHAAVEAGFNNVSYFSKLFEESFGLNPKSYLL
jgi:signal transduction histidine kinase/DNA-binding response OmpR family regulator